jgi:hypothetical protein
MDDWVRTYRHELDGDGVDPDALLEETKRRAAESRRMAFRLFERFWSDVARLPAGERSEPGSGRRAG